MSNGSSEVDAASSAGAVSTWGDSVVVGAAVVVGADVVVGAVVSGTSAPVGSSDDPPQLATATDNARMAASVVQFLSMRRERLLIGSGWHILIEGYPRPYWTRAFQQQRRPPAGSRRQGLRAYPAEMLPTQSKDRVTAFCQRAYRASRAFSDTCGDQRRSSCQLRRRSSRLSQNPSASPAP